MDPTVSLRKIRDLARSLDSIDVYDSVGNVDETAARRFVGEAGDLLAWLQGLDSFLSRGGYLPAQWSEAKAA